MAVSDGAAFPLGSARGRPAQATATAAATFRQVYDQAMPEVYRYLFRRCGGIRSLAEDLTQETFLVAVRASKDGQVTLPWLIGVARNKLLEHWRRERREALRLARRAAVMTEDAAASPDGADVLDALNRLPPLHRFALTLRYIDDLSVAEVAAILGKSLHATESILARARATFKRHYVEPADE